MDKKKGQKGRIVRKVWIKRKDKGKYGLWKGRKGRILQKIWIESKNRKKKSIFIYFEYDNLNHLINY